MKDTALTFETMLRALKRQWKLFAAVVLCFALLGAAAGAVWSQRMSSGGGGFADPYRTLDLSSFSGDRNFYHMCFLAFAQYDYDLCAYLEKLLAETTLTDTQRQTLHGLEARLEHWEAEQLDPALRFYESHRCIPPEFAEQELLDAKREILELERRITAGDTSPELPAYLSARASEVRILEENADELRAESEAMELVLSAVADALNRLIGELNVAVQNIAVENHFEVTFEYTDKYGWKDYADYSLVHSHNPITPQENFAVIVLFFVLVGICAGAYFAVCREASQDSRRSNEI